MARRDANLEPVKNKIIDAYRRGVCDHNGVTLPKSRQGMAGKGSHFRPRRSQAWYDNYDRIFRRDSA